jgi:hypothetical protein
MSKQAACVCAAVCAAVLVVPSAARADNTTCANATWIVPDGSVIELTFPSNDQRWYRFAARADRSYAIMTENPNPDGTITGGMIAAEAPCGTAHPVFSTSFMEPTAYSGTAPSRRSLVPTATQDIFIGVIGSTGNQFRIRVEDTTQVNTFFSTFSGFETFYRFANTTNSSVTYTLKMIDDLGNVVATTSATIAGNRSGATRNTSPGDLNVADNTAGFAIITHNGTPGAIAADGFLSNGTAVLPLKIVNSRQSR